MPTVAHTRHITNSVPHILMINSLRANKSTADNTTDFTARNEDKNRQTETHLAKHTHTLSLFSLTRKNARVASAHTQDVRLTHPINISGKRHATSKKTNKQQTTSRVIIMQHILYPFLSVCLCVCPLGGLWGRVLIQSVCLSINNKYLLSHSPL